MQRRFHIAVRELVGAVHALPPAERARHLPLLAKVDFNGFFQRKTALGLITTTEEAGGR